MSKLLRRKIVRKQRKRQLAECSEVPQKEKSSPTSLVMSVVKSQLTIAGHLLKLCPLLTENNTLKRKEQNDVTGNFSRSILFETITCYPAIPKTSYFLLLATKKILLFETKRKGCGQQHHQHLSRLAWPTSMNACLITDQQDMTRRVRP